MGMGLKSWNTGFDDCDWELSPLVWNENGTQFLNWRKWKTGTGN